MTVSNPQNMVLDVAKSYQLENGESQDLCGNFGVATLAYAGLPGHGPSGNGEAIDQYADQLATKYNAGVAGELGSTDQDMYNYLADATNPKGQRLLHWWVIPTDETSIKRALSAGYPVLVTANEQNIRSMKTGQRPPYPWNLNANHIIPLMGYDKNGNYVVADYLNNSFQGEWPCIYDAKVLAPTWACCVQVVGPDEHNPWLAPIPSGTPLTWKEGWNAQLFAQAAVPTPPGNPLPINQVLTIVKAIKLAEQAGFKDAHIVEIVAIAIAESGLQSSPKDNVNTDGSRDRGILQFNSKFHPEITDAMAYDPATAFKEAFRISNNGTSFIPWSTFTKNSYLSHIGDVFTVYNNDVYTQACDMWNSSLTKAPINTGIFYKWLVDYIARPWGIPVSLEVHTHNWSGNPIIAQSFSNGYHVELNGDSYTLYNSVYKGVWI